ncbi:hypothetical protein ACFYPT_38860 [Streptomyces sp. NPDC005529]|uniref:hypothetical protein n=1 Tax=unclassified Streptomyces TaxID=2593676 RepID=UPI0033B75D48
MDLYLVSDICECTGTEEYEAYMAARAEALQYYPDVHGRIPEHILKAMTRKLGHPVFPDGVYAEVHTEGVSLDDVVAAINSNDIVIFGGNVHWLVIYGYKKFAGYVARFQIFDPETDTYLVDIARDLTDREAIIVRRA